MTSGKPHYENVPHSWCSCTFDDIFEITMGSSPTGDSLNRSKNGIEFHQGKINYTDKFLSKSDVYTSSPTKYGEAYSLLLCVRAPVGLVNITQRKICIGRGLCSLFPKSSVDLMFAFYALQTYQDYFECKATGSTFKAIGGDIIRDAVFLLPPYNEQLRIVAEIEKWFALIDYIESGKQELQYTIKQIKRKILDLAIQGKLVAQESTDEPAFELLKKINPRFIPCDTSHYENLPKGWTICLVGEVANYINGRAFKPSEWDHDGLPIIRIQNLNDINAPYNYTTASYEDRYKITKGDLLFAWAASLGTYIWEGGDAWLNQHIFKVEPNAFMDKHFLYYSLINLIAEFYRQSHGSGMVHITKDKFEQTRIMIPPLPEQKRIVQSIENTYKIIDTINAEL